MLVCGIDPGASPGWACGEAGVGAQLSTELEPGWRELEFALVATELQFQPKTKVRTDARTGRKIRVRGGDALALATTAGFQLAQPRLAPGGRRLGFEPRAWRGLLWADGAAGSHGLAKEACLERLRSRLGSAIGCAGLSEDQLEAWGIWLAACAVGLKRKGQLLDGQAWALVKKPWGYKVAIATAAQSSARRFLRRRQA